MSRAESASGAFIAEANFMLRHEEVFGFCDEALFSCRIPALVALPDGSLCAFCEARLGTGGDWDPMSLRARRRGPDGVWEAARDVARNAHGPVHNPAPFVVGDEVHLLYCRDYARCFHAVSRDGGRTFGEGEDITYVFESFRGRDVPGGIDWHCIAVGPGGVTRLEGGRLVAPVWLGGLVDPHRHDPCQTATIYSDDGGTSWHAGEVLDMFRLGPSEAQVVALPKDAPARALISLRNQGAQRRRAFASSPDGIGWSKPWLADNVTEINCQGSLIRRGNLLVITGPEPEGEERERRVRRRLTLRASRDWGRTWSRGRVLCEGASGYSALALDGQGNLCCLYETWEDAHLVRLRLLTVPARELEELLRD